MRRLVARARLASFCAALLLPGAARAALEDVIQTAKPSVVAVGTYSATDNPRFRFRGSGFVVGAGNLVVTNAHVLPDTVPEPSASGAVVVVAPRAGGADGVQPRSATLAALDREHDLALLRIDGPPLPAMRLAEPGQVREGNAVAIIGFPIGGALGFTPVTHRGIVSSITAIALPAPTAQTLNNQAISRLRQGSFDIFQLDATAYPGNSGGPVLDATTGEVVAVINMVLVKGTKETAITHPSGISYAIPVRFVVELLKNR